MPKRRSVRKFANGGLALGQQPTGLGAGIPSSQDQQSLKTTAVPPPSMGAPTQTSLIAAEQARQVNPQQNQMQNQQAGALIKQFAGQQSAAPGQQLQMQDAPGYGGRGIPPGGQQVQFQDAPGYGGRGIPPGGQQPQMPMMVTGRDIQTGQVTQMSPAIARVVPESMMQPPPPQISSSRGGSPMGPRDMGQRAAEQKRFERQNMNRMSAEQQANAGFMRANEEAAQQAQRGNLLASQGPRGQQRAQALFDKVAQTGQRAQSNLQEELSETLGGQARPFVGNFGPGAGLAPGGMGNFGPGAGPAPRENKVARGFKKGGLVKAKAAKKKAGPRRGDGCCIKGFTRARSK